jgi:uncharacterized repeat protein (TIGR03943 family)
VNHDLSGAVVVAFGVICVRLAASDGFLAYLKPGMKVPLVVTGVALIVLGVATIWRSSAQRRAERADVDPVAAHGDVDPGPATGPAASTAGDTHHDDHGHDHGRVPRVAWLLVLPLLALVLVEPAPLGAYAAERQSTYTPGQRASFPPMPAARDGAVELRMSELLQRAIWDPDRSLEDVPVRVSGFVVPDHSTEGAYYLTRFVLACCAADARPIHVRVVDAPGPVPPTDTWLSVVGTWVPSPDGGYDLTEGPPVVEVSATTATVIPTPTQPYE